MNKVFRNVGGASPPRSIFNLSYEKKMTADMGYLYPVMCDEVVPGDIFDIGCACVVRAQPLVAPILHEVNISAYYFFVPYRLIYEDWEDFITGGPDGSLTPTLPRWYPNRDVAYADGSLWDYMGMPTLAAYPGIPGSTNYPLAFPPRAYAFIYNEYFRDQSLQDEISYLDYDGFNNDSLDDPIRCNYEKDYFTSAQLTQQRGTAPAVPIVGTSSAVWDGASFQQAAGVTAAQFSTTAADPQMYVNNATAYTNAMAMFNQNTVDGATFSISASDIRLTFQVQKWLERNQRAGVRYTEFLRAQFSVSPNDERLDRPEYIGGMKAPIIFSEVLQTSQTATTPQGTLAGHGLSVNLTPIGKYRVEEFGLIMGIMRIMPKNAYQQGINRQWSRRTKYDFYFPVFANLSEQAIEQGELYWQGIAASDQTPFGFCGAYDEMRTKNDMVHGLMRSTYDYWHIGRQFGSAPVLDTTFIRCNPRKDCFAVQDEPGFVVQWGNLIKALRPMPIIAEPGLLDHN